MDTEKIVISTVTVPPINSNTNGCDIDFNIKTPEIISFGPVDTTPKPILESKIDIDPGLIPSLIEFEGVAIPRFI